jgi:hypothetical protein
MIMTKKTDDLMLRLEALFDAMPDRGREQVLRILDAAAPGLGAALVEPDREKRLTQLAAVIFAARNEPVSAALIQALRELDPELAEKLAAHRITGTKPPPRRRTR